MNYLCCRSFRINDQNLSGMFFRRSSFYSKIYQQSLRKTTSKESVFRVGNSESINKIFEKDLRRNLNFKNAVLDL